MATSDPQRGDRPRRGAVLMMLAAMAFTAMIGFVKVARAELGALEIMVWRGLFGVPLMLLIVRRRGHSLAIAGRRVFLLRTAFGFGAMFCFYTATKELALADVALIHKLQPILVAFAAPLLLGASERFDRSIWVVLVAGMVGCGILLAPQGQMDLGAGLWAVGATLFSAMAHLCVRKLGQSDEPSVIVFWFQTVMAIVAAVVVGVSEGIVPRAPLHLLPVLLGCAFSATVGQLLLTMAYQADRAGRVAAASYVGPVWAVLADIVVFGLWPRPEALIGGTIIVGAGLWLLRGRPDPQPSSSQRVSQPAPGDRVSRTGAPSSSEAA